MMRVEKRRLSMRNGSEGPHYDPYSFTELTVETNDQKVTLHLGLAQWLKMNGKAVGHPSFNEAAEDLFEGMTGIHPDKFIHYYYRIRERCKKCGSKKQEAFAGYPGETIYCCANCGAPVYSHQDMSYII